MLSTPTAHLFSPDAICVSQSLSKARASAHHTAKFMQRSLRRALHDVALVRWHVLGNERGSLAL